MFESPPQTPLGARLCVVQTVPASLHAHESAEPSCPGPLK
jgi:hypothetical protein